MPSAAVLGGGIAGLAAGVALGQAGWQVTIFERTQRLEAIGAALSLWPNAVEGLRQLGVLEDVCRRAMPFHTMLVANNRERPIIPARQVDGQAMMVTRTDLQGALACALPEGTLSLGREVTSVSDEGDAVTVGFLKGRAERVDLVVDAGGLRSVAADPAVTYRGYGGVVALSDPINDEGTAGLAAEYWGWRERFGLFELTGDRRYWFFMRDQPANAAPPSHAEVSSRASGFPPAVRRAIAATPPERLIPFSIHARPAPRSLGMGRVIRIGDAAHGMEPNLGQGACQAIEDAVALGAVARARCAGDMLTSFEHLRLKRVAGIVRRAAEGRHGAHGPLATQWMTRTLLRAVPMRLSDRLARSIQTMPAYEL